MSSEFFPSCIHNFSYTVHYPTNLIWEFVGITGFYALRSLETFDSSKTMQKPHPSTCFQNNWCLRPPIGEAKGDHHPVILPLRLLADTNRASQHLGDPEEDHGETDRFTASQCDRSTPNPMVKSKSNDQALWKAKVYNSNWAPKNHVRTMPWNEGHRLSLIISYYCGSNL